MAGAIVKLLKNKTLAERMGKAGRESVINKFGDEMMVKKIDTLYNELLMKKSSLIPDLS